MRVGVVLFQLGGPESIQAIEPFLYNLFCDPDIIDFPFARVARRPLARMIAANRAKRVAHHYSAIGGGSPLRRITEQQAAALEFELRRQGIDARCFVAMRYWHPLTQEAAAQVRQARCSPLVLLPLYPQYSSTTTGSSLNEWHRCFGYDVPFYCIESFYSDPLFLEALAHHIDRTLRRFPDPRRPTLIFSAHSVPAAVIEDGDPYQEQIVETVKLVMERGGWRNRHELCYQSKVGASRWLQPTLRSTLRRLARDGVREVCVAPVAFVSDHLETLGEIDHEARRLAAELGMERFEMMPGLNDSPKFIAALAGQVKQALEEMGAHLLPLVEALAVDRHERN